MDTDVSKQFEKIKQALSTTTVLAHFDPDMYMLLACHVMVVQLAQ